MSAAPESTRLDAEPGLDLKVAMPLTASWIAMQRNCYGKAHVNQCIRKGMAGQPGWFHAWEAGHMLGTPALMDLPAAYVMSMSWMTGAPFIAAIREPEGEYRVAVGDQSLKTNAKGKQ
jgi:hypothetical protein